MWTNGEWTVHTAKGTILDSKSMEETEERLGIPLPEMIFGSSVCRVEHVSGWALDFNPVNALDQVGKTGENLLEVAYSKEWRDSRVHEAHGHSTSKIHRPFDWTYSQTYMGDEAQPLLKPAQVEVPFDRLKVHKPILLFDEIPLYEDELGDNGLVDYTAKIRVMDTEMLILVRLYLRVDDVIFRIRDTRVFIDFTNNQVIRTYVQKEGTFDKVKARVPPKSEDFTQYLRNPDWIASILPQKSFSSEEAFVPRTQVQGES